MYRVFINSLGFLSQVQAHQVVLSQQLQDVQEPVEQEAQALDEVVEDQASLAQALVQACQDGRQVKRLVAQEVQALKVLLAPLHAHAQQELVEWSPQAQYRVVEAQAPLAQALEHEEQVHGEVSQILEENVRKR
jgi:leucyl-tRNA synthetase